MYPSDDGPIRLRLLTAQCREVRQRMEEQISELRALRAGAPGGPRRTLRAPPARGADDPHER